MHSFCVIVYSSDVIVYSSEVIMYFSDVTVYSCSCVRSSCFGVMLLIIVVIVVVWFSWGHRCPLFLTLLCHSLSSIVSHMYWLMEKCPSRLMEKLKRWTMHSNSLVSVWVVYTQTERETWSLCVGLLLCFVLESVQYLRPSEYLKGNIIFSLLLQMIELYPYHRLVNHSKRRQRMKHWFPISCRTPCVQLQSFRLWWDICESVPVESSCAPQVGLAVAWDAQLFAHCAKIPFISLSMSMLITISLGSSLGTRKCENVKRAIISKLTWELLNARLVNPERLSRQVRTAFWFFVVAVLVLVEPGYQISMLLTLNSSSIESVPMICWDWWLATFATLQWVHSYCFAYTSAHFGQPKSCHNSPV